MRGMGSVHALCQAPLRAWWLLCVMMPCLCELSSCALRSCTFTLSSSERVASACRERAVASSRLLSTARCAQHTPSWHHVPPAFPRLLKVHKQQVMKALE